MNNERGFTLLEVLVATVIMAIAIAGTLAALSGSTRNASRLTDYDRASILAHRKMDELMLQDKVIHGALLQGLFAPGETNGEPAGWRAQVTPFEGPANPPPGTRIVERVELEVWWRNGARENKIQLEGFRRTTLTEQKMGRR